MIDKIRLVEAAWLMFRHDLFIWVLYSNRALPQGCLVVFLGIGLGHPGEFFIALVTK
jgi:hypothetical protein